MSYPQQFGTYVLLEHLGTGGMSQVDLARRAAGEGAYVRFVVIKRIHTKNEGSERHVVMFQDEARIQAELSHTNIAQLYDFGEEGDSFYLAMEYVPGMDLRSVQRSLLHRHRKRIPLRMALSLVAETLEGLAYAHSAVDTFGRPMDVVHRDINPRNVMLSVSGDVKIIDFGVAKAVDKLDTTRTNALKGKIAYMAPEQMDSQPIDGRADLFAVGLMLQEFVNGASPFSGLNEIQIMKRVLDGNLGELKVKGHPDPDLLQTIRSRAVATNPDERYQKAEHFLRDIELALVPLGGRCSREERAAFLREIDPILMERIEKRLADYRRGIVPTDQTDRTPSEPTLLEGSMSKTVNELDPSTELSRSAVTASSVGWMAVGGAVGAGLLVATWLVLGQGKRSNDLELPEVPAAEIELIDAEKPVEPQPNAKPPPAEPEPAVLPNPIGEEAIVVPEPVEATDPEPTGASETLNAPVELSEVRAPAEQRQATEESAIAPPQDAGPEQDQELVEPVSSPTEAVPERILFINSFPEGLSVWVDGQEVGRTPVRLKVAVGTHEVEVRNPARGKNQVREVEVRLDGRNLENFTF